MLDRTHLHRFMAVQNTHPSVVALNGEREALDDDGNIVELDESKIAPEIVKINAEYENDYKRKRMEEYRKLNQFELIGEDSINGTTNHKDAILAIKAKYPKG